MISTQRDSNGRIARIVTDPQVEQVAEDEDRVGSRVAQVRGECRDAGWAIVGQVQVADEVDALPVGRRLELPEARQRRRSRRARRLLHRPRAAHSTTRGALDHDIVDRHVVERAAASGAWSFSIASTTSVPSTTLPNTA